MNSFGYGRYSHASVSCDEERPNRMDVGCDIICRLHLSCAYWHDFSLDEFADFA